MFPNDVSRSSCGKDVAGLGVQRCRACCGVLSGQLTALCPLQVSQSY